MHYRFVSRLSVFAGITLVLCSILSACDYTAPLVEHPAIKIDRSVIGLWERTVAEKRSERLLVLPFDDRQYLLSYPAGSPDTLFGKACLWRRDNRTLVQINWVGTGAGTLPETNRTFQFAAYEKVDDTLVVRLVNPEVVSKDIDSTAELARAVEKNWHKRNFFREATTFSRVKN